MNDHDFDRAIQLQADDSLDLSAPSGGLATMRYLAHTSEPYWNAISPFGGTTVALVLNAILQHPQRLGDPLAMTVNFAGPIQKGPMLVEVSPIRTGRSTQHWAMSIRQQGDDSPLLTGTAVFAVRRDTWSDSESRMPAAPPPETLERQTPPANVPFLERYAMRYVDSHPLQGGDSSLTQCWISDLPPRPVDFPSLAAYCDSFAPRLFVRKGAPRPISTVSLSINFHIDGEALANEQCLAAFGRSRANGFYRGYYDQEAVLWSPRGSLLATTHQMVWFRD
ncbi:acyl-CoA thioesterase [Noviherbaspirillum galbum]|uniref:Thioesterase family protein n=1 Tax=Noviherbaspirillum galbum TaxID=2709383 RepID=A0A6B3SQ35_9BURK|nr:thioesterase family protein [Noviherbaspirillum galbum]NEX60522.1 thioesterase family protein [Noviherbaspirillum galbum]